MRFLILSFLILTSISAQANFAEFFGADAKSSALANQYTGDHQDASNNYYLPAALSYSKDVLLNISSYYVDPNFQSIDNITTVNSVTHDGPTSVSTDYESSKIYAVHFSLPIQKRDGAKFAVSFFAPMKSVLESDSGDTFTPNYVMYQSRYQRTIFYANLAYPLTPSWAFSIGAYSGFQVVGDTYLMSGADGGPKSHGQMQVRVKPSLAAQFSVLKKGPTADYYLAFQQEMKSKLTAHVHGEAAPPISLLYNFDVYSLLYYDPMLIRLGYNKKFANWKIITSLEYQFWENYESAVLRVERSNGMGIVTSGGNYEQIKAQNILIPKIALEHALNDHFNIAGGFAFRPTPIKGDFSSSGNSIDSDTFIYSLGAGYHFSLFGKKARLSSSIQHHHLKEQKVVKSSGMEDGSSGNKIGYPGYTIGGSITSFSLGINLQI